MSFDTPAAPQVQPMSAAAPPPPMYAQDKQQGKKKPKSQQPTALSAGMVGPGLGSAGYALGQKTLLGQ